jgi:hypothetical protein
VFVFRETRTSSLAAGISVALGGHFDLRAQAEVPGR